MQIFKADGTTPVTVGGTVTAAELQGSEVQDGGQRQRHGEPDLDGDRQRQHTPPKSQTLTESLAITVTAVNDAPVRTAGTLTAITVDEDSANTTAVTLGLSAVTYGPGGGADEASQTLTYTIGTIPSYVQFFKADGTTR